MVLCKRILLLLTFYMLYLDFWVYSVFFQLPKDAVGEPWILSMSVLVLIFSVPVFYPTAIFAYVVKNQRLTKILTGLLLFGVIFASYYAYVGVDFIG